MILPQAIDRRKRSIERRLNGPITQSFSEPMLGASNIHYELADRTRAISHGGIGLVHQLVREIGLAEAINRRVHVLKIHLPYHESDHVLNIAYNAICEGRCLEDIELRRNDEVFLDALGTQRIPDPTTAGDFCRRFSGAAPIDAIQDAFDEARRRVWARQPKAFFARATIDMDGHLVETAGECKLGMDIAYDGTWGYHVLLMSLANTGEVLRVVNRPGNRPSHEGAAAECDRAIGLCRQAGFCSILLRGDTDFSQTKHLDRWDAGNVTFHFGYDAAPNLKEIAENLPPSAWKKLVRPPAWEPRAGRRRRPDKVKQEIIRRREFEVLKLQSEEVAEFDYRPRECRKAYRMVVIRKNISKEKGEKRLIDEIRYFFYITNDRKSTSAEVVFSANDRCNQENLIEQLSNGVRAFHAPVDNLFSNWAYMAMTALAWNLKAWWALWLPEQGRWAEKHQNEKQTILRMEYRAFVNLLVKIPCQIIRTGRRLIYRLLNWTPWLGVFRRLANALNC